MDEKIRAGLTEGGIDLEDIFTRLPGREELIKRLLLKFPAEECHSGLQEAIKKKDYQAAFGYAHDMKGLVANLGMKPLYEKTSILVERLRDGQYDGLEELLAEVDTAYRKVTEAIDKFLA